MLTTSPELVSQLTCDLLRIRPDRPYLHNAPAPSIFSGPTTGCHTRNRWVWTPSYPLWRDKLPYLRVLAHRIRSGAASRSGQPVRAPRVRDEILAIAKGFTDMGLPDPHLTSAGLMDPRLTRLYSAYSHEDPAPHRVKPLPIQIIHHANATFHATPTAKLTAAMEMIWIAFFFLLRPGEYCSASDNQPLCMGHVTFTIGHQKLHTITASDADLHCATHVSLTFDDQKNRKRGEVIGHARSGHSSACPVHATVHLRPWHPPFHLHIH